MSNFHQIYDLSDQPTKCPKCGIRTEILIELKLKIVYKDSRELIKTDSNFGNANINFELTNYLIQYYFEREQADIIVLPGFIGLDNHDNTTTLGRGGSDYTASIIAGALNSEQVEIWTDVSGMYTCNPNIVKSASDFFPIFNQPLQMIKIMLDF